MQNKLFLPLLFLFFLVKTSDSFSVGGKEAPADSTPVTPPAEQHRFGFMDANAYYDTRDASTISINYLALLNKRLSYFAFVNFQQGAPGKVPNIWNFDFFYSEHNLTYTPFLKIPIDINAQMVMVSLPNSTKFRFAPSLRVHDIWGIKNFFKKINLRYGINFHVVQFGNEFPLDDFDWQMEHFYRWDILPKLTKNRIYISGFTDHTFGGPMSAGVVGEHQLGIRLFDQFYAVAEYRYFSYFPDQYKEGVGLGLEYCVLFK
jgi:hypothetical protein